MKINVHFLNIYRRVLLRMRNVSDGFVEKIKMYFCVLFFSDVMLLMR
jgi:hypothetical protein